MLQIKRIEDCMEYLQVNAEKYEQVQSITILIEDLGILMRSMAFVNNQMAIAKRELNEAKVAAYRRLEFSTQAAGINMPPSLAKDYVNSLCVIASYNYDIAERCSRTIVHMIDVLRTCISALKEEAKYSNYH